MPASINQMLSGGIIVSTCILSRLILGRTVHPHNALGCAIAVVGFVFVGFASLTNGNALEQYGVQSMTIGICNFFLGEGLMVCSNGCEQLVRPGDSVYYRRVCYDDLSN